MPGKCKYLWKSQSSVALHYMKCDQMNLNNNNSKIPLVIVIVPGNPGPITLYDKFSETLNSLTSVPVWGISHTGHVRQDDNKGLKHPSKDDCGLEKQILHKIDFLRDEVFPRADKVILIGHSIGCYIILQIMERMQSDQLVNGILLFPTIERMSSTPQGKVMTPVLRYGRWLFMFIVEILSYLPDIMKDILVSRLVNTNENCIKESIKSNMSDPQSVDSMTYMALEEMCEVDKRDDHILKKYMDKLIFYYGVDDHWCPISYYQEVFNMYNKSKKIVLCEKNIPHAFVLKNSVECANIVAKWIKD